MPKQKGREMGVGGSRLNYENTAPIDKDLCNTIPLQGDVVLRYTPDPTESVKVNGKCHPEVIKPFSCSTQQCMKFQLFIKAKMLEIKGFSCFQTLVYIVFVLLINVNL